MALVEAKKGDSIFPNWAKGQKKKEIYIEKIINIVKSLKNHG